MSACVRKAFPIITLMKVIVLHYRISGRLSSDYQIPLVVPIYVVVVEFPNGFWRGFHPMTVLSVCRIQNAPVSLLRAIQCTRQLCVTWLIAPTWYTLWFDYNVIVGLRCCRVFGIVSLTHTDPLVCELIQLLPPSILVKAKPSRWRVLVQL